MLKNLPFPDNSFDFIVSNNTFEHIYEEALVGILKSFKRVLKPEGLMSHFIDMSDHFAHLDSSITIYNFLQYSSASWNRIDNSIQPQNRMRITHFRELYQTLNIPITKEDNRSGDLNALKSIIVDDFFKNIPEKDLAVSHSYVVSYFKEQTQ